MAENESRAPVARSRTRFIVGSAVFGIGFLAPLLVPLVTASGLSAEWKTGLSGLLLFGIPEIGMLVAVAIMGKDGYEALKGILRRLGLHDRAGYFTMKYPGEHSDYLICRACGSIEELDIACPVEALEMEISRESGYRELYHELEFFGVCPKCA